MASIKCLASMFSFPSKSAIVRDILRILSNDLAENLYLSNANCMMEFSSSFNLQYFLICRVFICALVVMFSFSNRCFWISRAASTRFLICSDVTSEFDKSFVYSEILVSFDLNVALIDFSIYGFIFS